MEMCDYEDCNQEGSIVVCYSPLYVKVCDEHYPELYKKFLKSKKSKNCNLGQSIHDYVRADGSRGRLTVGKDSEIAARTITPEGEVINRHTKKPAQY
jgi:hypothetical protein